MKLKAEVKTTIHVSYRDLEEFILHIYGRSLDIYEDIQMDRDHDECFFIKKVEPSKYDKRDLARWLSGKEEIGMLRTLLEDMANRDLIDEGIYYIHI